MYWYFFFLLCSNQWLKLSTLVLPLEDENFYFCVNMGFRKHGSLGFKESFFLNNICDCGFFLIWLLKSFTWPLLKTVCKQFLKSSCDYCQIAFWKWCCVLFENLFENFVDCYLENNFVNDFEFYEKKRIWITFWVLFSRTSWNLFLSMILKTMLRFVLRTLL